MHLHLKTLAGALLACTLSQSEVPAQSPDSGANPKARVPPSPPAAPVPPSPIDYFRKLIESSPAEREKLLGNKTPDQMRVLTNSLRTYLEMSPADRELRLRSLELRCYLAPLLETAATNRARSLATVPEGYRGLLREGLASWDRLPADVQRKLLERERAQRLAGLIMPPLPPVQSLPPLPAAPAGLPVPGRDPGQVPSSDKAVRSWPSYPEAKRQEIIARFDRLSDFPEPKKAIAPLPLNDAEREQMERTLETYRKLSPAHRAVVLNSFKKFADLLPEERRQFLRNAESWQAMGADERERWRQLVNNLPQLPPLPPGFGAPPFPPTPAGAGHTSLVVSNTLGKPAGVP